MAGILVLAGIITVLTPDTATAPAAEPETEVIGTAQLVAPVPYGGSGGSGTAAQTLDWGAVGPVRQTADTGYTYTAAAAPVYQTDTDVPEFGRVTTEWFADAAFLGDSITAGFCESEYDIDVGGALICAYEGTSPNQIVNRTTLTNPDRGEEVAMDVLTEAQPKKLYILLGTNALVAEGNDEGFLNYYGRMLDELQAALPDCMIFVQSVLPVRPDALEDAPGLGSARLASVNAALRELCAARGLYFLDLNAEFSDESGDLQADYAQPDGIHLTVSGYSKWVSFLCTHTPYSKDNPYQAGSEWYLTDSLKELLSDLP